MSTPQSRMFNGSVLTFDGTPVARIVDMAFKSGGAKVDVTQPADLNKLFELGQTDLDVTMSFKGGCSLIPGTKGSLAITWTDGTTTTCPDTWQIGPVETKGAQDAAITGTAQMWPTVPDLS